MNQLAVERRAFIVQCLCEGNSARSTARLARVSLTTVLKLIIDIGTRCWEIEKDLLRNLPARIVQVDEMWSYVYAKDRNVPAKYKKKRGYGAVWTWVAIDAVSKFVLAWHIGGRSERDGWIFLRRLRRRLLYPVTLHSDGYVVYKSVLSQIPKVDHVLGDTSFVERNNLTIRMAIRRFARKTNAFSKQFRFHRYMLAIFFLYYNFCRGHISLGGDTPAMALGIEDYKWDMTELVSD